MAGIRCGIAFHSIDEFRAGFVANGPACFVPYPDEVEPGAVMEVDVTLGESRLELRGEVMSADFDESGNVGLKVQLDEASWQAVAKFARDYREGSATDGIFATTRMQIRPIVATVPAAPMEHEDRAERLDPGAVVDGRFRIESHLATGGMGEVYRAEHVHLKRPIALKLLRRALSRRSTHRDRFDPLPRFTFDERTSSPASSACAAQIVAPKMKMQPEM